MLEREKDYAMTGEVARATSAFVGATKSPCGRKRKRTRLWWSYEEDEDETKPGNMCWNTTHSQHDEVLSKQAENYSADNNDEIWLSIKAYDKLFNIGKVVEDLGLVEDE
ncbi:Hypothetical protein PHPALM_20610 [Phytophthora palmivora]|uniref:Uncharacterized protein n=1 Tax=Phytophthora palmivora TaxID=4796 RepID=A0A2P4XEF3_9STRA|nr:Hypothetical protein PHPALM_20610 [Phytophthora palmivora]